MFNICDTYVFKCFKFLFFHRNMFDVLFCLSQIKPKKINTNNIVWKKNDRIENKNECNNENDIEKPYSFCFKNIFDIYIYIYAQNCYYEKTYCKSAQIKITKDNDLLMEKRNY